MPKIINLAIVIPTLNEEKFIGILLDSIKKQTVWPKEIIVVDGSSTDKTILEIKKRQKDLPQLKFFQIPKYTISRQRNYGVSKSKSEHILFLDADVKLISPKTLEDYWKTIQKTKLDAIMAPNFPLSNSIRDYLLYKVTHGVMALSSNTKIWPMAVGTNLYFNRKIFSKVGGFDEEVRVAEDFELVQRVVKNGGRYKVVRHPKIHSSVRRLRKEGRLRFFWKLGVSGYYIKKYGFRKNPIHYEFGKY